MKALQDKVCLVTGGAGSLGRAIAKLFVTEGAKLVLSDLDQDALVQAGAEISADRIALVAGDVTRAEDAARMVETAIASFGRLDIVVSNAGNFGTVAPIERYPEEVFDAVYRVHVKGAFLLCQAAVPRMAGGGSIVIMSSVAGTRGDPGVYGYITAKHAQVGLMRCLAKELAPRRIRVNTLHPGPVANSFQGTVEQNLTGMLGRDGTEFFNEIIPLGRHAEPDEIARSALYLASDQSSFTTGTTLMIDGGMSA
jgi:NAD(P)-dependent dehydrogenase (short-subunit alcohol dehydrogenase family)